MEFRRGRLPSAALQLPFGDAHLPIVGELAAPNNDPARVRPLLADCLFGEAERIGCGVQEGQQL